MMPPNNREQNGSPETIILINVKIFQFPHGTCRIIGQHASCGKENLIVSEYRIYGTLIRKDCI